MCAIQKMQTFSIAYGVKYEAAKFVLQTTAEARGIELESYLDIVQGNPDLEEYLARVAMYIPDYKKGENNDQQRPYRSDSCVAIRSYNGHPIHVGI